MDDKLSTLSTLFSNNSVPLHVTISIIFIVAFIITTFIFFFLSSRELLKKLFLQEKLTSLLLNQITTLYIQIYHKQQLNSFIRHLYKHRSIILSKMAVGLYLLLTLSINLLTDAR